MNKKILSILAFNLLIFSFQLNAMKKTLSRDVTCNRRTSPPFCCGTPPATVGSPAAAGFCEEFSLEMQNELPVFKSQTLNKFIKENNLNSYSIFSEDWSDIVCECGDDFRVFCPKSEILFLVACVFCRDDIGVEDDVSVLKAKLDSLFWSWVRGMFVRYKEACKQETDVKIVFKNCVENLNETVFPGAILIAAQEEDLAVQQFLTNKIEEYNRILNQEDRED